MANKEPTSVALDATGRSQDSVQLEFKEQLRASELRMGNLVTTAQWTDMLHNAHDRAFTVAGAMKADLLADLVASIDQRLKRHDGGLEGFRKDFDRIVEKHGWAYNGERNWRTRTIYKTNMLTSYASGRLAQLKNPKLTAVAPWWTYRHNDNVIHPRPHHYKWGQIQLTLPHDHPFWATHYPPNGWGCHCYVTAKRKPPAGADTVPPAGWDDVDDKTGAPPGIDKGWGYQPGMSVVDELQGFVDKKVEGLPPGLGSALKDDKGVINKRDSLGGLDDCDDSVNFADDGQSCLATAGGQNRWDKMGLQDLRDLKERLAIDSPELLKAGSDQVEALDILRSALNIKAFESRQLVTPVRDILIHDWTLSHIVEKRQDARERYALFIEPTLTSPLEVWRTEYADGEYREQFIKLFKGRYDLLAIVRINTDGSLLWNVMQRKTKGMNSRRIGELIWKGY